LFQTIHNQKGQAIFDLAFGSFIFLLVLIAVISLYQQALIDSNSLNENELLQEKAFLAVERLLNSRGEPENWVLIPFNDVNSVGLLNSEGFVTEEKLLAFINADYNSSKSKLGLQNYEFYFEFSGVDSVQAGLVLEADFDSVVVRRIVPYKGGEAIVDFTTYKTD
jgi:hypothetical protein